MWFMSIWSLFLFLLFYSTSIVHPQSGYLVMTSSSISVSEYGNGDSMAVGMLSAQSGSIVDQSGDIAYRRAILVQASAGGGSLHACWHLHGILAWRDE